MTTTLAEAHTSIHRRIAGLTETPGLDAQVLLAHACSRDRSWVLAHSEYQLDPEETLRLADSLAQFTAGVPLPYILGEWEFYGLNFKVSPQVLIPRPETELLVETAIEWLQAHPDRRRAVEAGTGSGCIAVSLAASILDLEITATELSPAAAVIAQENAARHRVQTHVRVLVNDLLDGLRGPFDLIAANLPYIPSATLRQLKIYRHEPSLALDGGENGLEVIARLLGQAAEKLAEGGFVLLEIEAGQGPQAIALAAEHFPKARIEVRRDLAGLDRLLVVTT